MVTHHHLYSVHANPSLKPTPTGTRRNDNVIMTSKRRRFDVIMKFLLRPVSNGNAD